MVKRVRRAYGSHLNLLLSLILSLLLFQQLSVAQGWDARIFLSILGEAPRPCTGAKITPQCFECIVKVKILPLMFFFAIFFLVFFYLFNQLVERATPQGQVVHGLTKPEMKVVVVVSFILALIMLNLFPIRTILSQFNFWIGFVFFVLAVMVARAFGRVTGLVGFVFVIIIFIIILGALWSFIQGMIHPTLETFVTACV